MTNASNLVVGTSDTPTGSLVSQGSEDSFRVNTTTSGTQNNTNWNRFNNGTMVILYESNDAGNGTTDIRARFLDKFGQGIGPDFIVNQTILGNQNGAAIAITNDGKALITWVSYDPATPSQGQLFGRFYDTNGVALGNEFQISSNGADGAYSFFQRSNGTFVFAYQNDGEILGRTLTLSGASLTPLTAEVQLNTTLPGTPTQLGWQSLSNGNMLLRFASPEGATPPAGNGYEVRNRVFSLSGDVFTPVSISGSSNDYLVNTTLSGDQPRERTVRLASGHILEVWDSTDSGDGSGRCIRGRLLAADGTPIGSDFLVNTTVTGDQRNVNITSFDDGRRLIHWRSYEDGTLVVRGRWVWADADADAPGGATPNDGSSTVDWSSNDFIIGRLPDTSGGGYGLMILPNQQVVLIYEGIGADDDNSPAFSNGVTASLLLNLGGEITPTIWSDGGIYENIQSVDQLMASPFDLPLPSLTTTQAGEQLSRNITDVNNFNDAIGTPLTLTYAYRFSIENWTYGNGASGFSQFTAQQIAVMEAAIQLWEEVANIDLVRVQTNGAYSDAANLLFWNYTGATTGSAAASAAGFGGWNTGANPSDLSGYGYKNYAYFNANNGVALNPTVDNLGLRLMIHELGHALGLSHPGNYNIDTAFQTYVSDASFVEDSMMYTTMSYFDEDVTHANYESTGISTPLLIDIAALQRLYGANLTTRTGNTTYGFNSNTGNTAFTLTTAADKRVFSVWDAGGTDTFDFSGYSMDQLIDLREEQFSWVGGLTANVSIAKGAVIENAKGGSGNDMLLGNAANNLLEGGDGDDDLDGSTGTDTLLGGAGDDTLTNVDGLDTLDGGEGFDRARIDRLALTTAFIADFTNAPTDMTLADGTRLISIESIDIRTGSGNDSVTGTANDDDMEGNDGNDVLAGQAGYDWLDGGNGNDWLYGGSENDHLVGGDGIDWLYGGDGDDNLFGEIVPEGPWDFNLVQTLGTSVDALFGEAGNDFMIGGGGGDSLDGGTGNDNIYGGTGIDWIHGGADNDYISGGSETDALFGDDGDDGLFGDDGDDGLNGGNGIDHLNGGNGIDWLYGGAGNDYLNGGNETDALFGEADDDTLWGGNGDDSLDGGIGNDWLYGEAGIDWLFGGDGVDNLNGGSETDALFGQAGNDTLNGGTGGDNLDGGAGMDYLDGGDGVDWLYGGTEGDQLHGGNDGDQLYGEDGNDYLYGEAGNDGLDGGYGNDFLDGGAGNDVLIGYFGADTFRLHNSQADQDVIVDFETGIDKVHFDGIEFGLIMGPQGYQYSFETGAGLPTTLANTGPVFYFETGGKGIWFDPTGGATVDIIKIGGLQTGVLTAVDLVVL